MTRAGSNGKLESRAPWAWLARALAAALVAVLLVDAVARVGGGESYGGGGGGDGGGGDGGDAGFIIYLIFQLIRLCIHYPIVGIPLAIVICWVLFAANRKSVTSDQRGGGVQLSRQSAGVDELRQLDSNFSRVLLLDFVALLYTRAQEARASGNLAPLAPYLSDSARAQLLAGIKPEQVHGVIVGAVDIMGFSSHGGQDHLVVQIESNLNEVDGAGKDVKLFSMERWTLSRQQGVLSKGPAETRALNCPSCGYTVDLDPRGVCKACSTPVAHGEHAWQTTKIQVLRRGEPSPMALTLGGGMEVGFDHPTRFDPDLPAAQRAFTARHPEFDWKAFEARTAAIFLALQTAWVAQRWQDMRALETDTLFGRHRYWLERYKAEKLTSIMEKVEVLGQEIVKIEPDAFYEFITVRVRMQMLDFTKDTAGKVVAGSDKELRQASEYWTFIRTAGKSFGAAKAPDSCPNCGAPLDKMGQSGACGYCESIVSSGEYDWVAALIEQDESYRA